MSSTDALNDENAADPDIWDGRIWIGFSEAVDWIAFRGKIAPEEEYGRRLDEAVASLIGTLADLDPDYADGLVQGIRRGGSNPVQTMVPVPHGIWPVTTYLEGDEGKSTYHLLLVDSVSEWGGTLVARDHEYDQLRIRSFFIQQNWPEGESNPRPAKPITQDAGTQSKSYSEAQTKRFIERVINSTPEHLTPLTLKEIEGIVRSRYPKVPRDQVRTIFEALRPSDWPRKQGPRGPRQPDRANRFEEFREEMLAADLHN